MFFNSFIFIGFLLIVLLLLFAGKLCCRSIMLRNATLLLASYFFYGYFNLAFTLILAFVTIVNFIAGSTLIDGKSNKRKSIVAVSTILSLLPLFFYKYALFLSKSFCAVLSLEINLEQLEGIMLPVGISFFTFQALSYTIDAYRGKITENAGALDFFLFVAFFPTILSGPIEKARNLLPQIKRYYLPGIGDIVQGTCIFIWGLFKKIVIADRLAYYVDWAYGSSEYVSGLTLAVAAIFYSIQIYCDFSGYSDMALGVAKILGFNITKNFRQPYFSRTFKEFWHKWHIALTSWFTEYVYFSLGGSRVKFKSRWVFNISMIFLLSGIWHGAAWNFLVWGLLHAAFYLCEHFIGLQKKELQWSRLGSLISGIVVFVFVTIAWIFFRLETFGDAVFVISKICTDFGGSLSMGASSFTFASTFFMLVIFFVFEFFVSKRLLNYDINDYKPNIIGNMISIIPMLLLICMFGMESDNFVYFQF